MNCCFGARTGTSPIHRALDGSWSYSCCIRKEGSPTSQARDRREDAPDAAYTSRGVRRATSLAINDCHRTEDRLTLPPGPYKLRPSSVRGGRSRTRAREGGTRWCPSARMCTDLSTQRSMRSPTFEATRNPRQGLGRSTDSLGKRSHVKTRQNQTWN